MTPDEQQVILTHLTAALPNEGVALLATTADPLDSGLRRVTRIYPGTNTRSSPTRFDMDQLEIIRALRDIDDHGWTLGAIVHSHPRGPASPSATDLAEAFYPDALMVIVSFTSGNPDLRAWRLDGEPGNWVPAEIPVTISGRSFV